MRGCGQFCPVANAAEIVAERWTPLALRELLCADVKMLTRVWMGDVPMAAARHAGSVRLEGPTFLVRAFPAWLRLSSVARVERVATTAVAR